MAWYSQPDIVWIHEVSSANFTIHACPIIRCSGVTTKKI